MWELRLWYWGQWNLLSEMWCHVILWIATNVAEEPATSLFTVYEEWKTDLLSATIIRIVVFFC
jgi:hypothetical protein